MKKTKPFIKLSYDSLFNAPTITSSNSIGSAILISTSIASLKLFCFTKSFDT